MCFNQPMSLAFACMGLGVAAYIQVNTSNWQLAVGVGYFFLMELLQFFQYYWIDDCDNQWNKWLTLAGFAHICYQPFFTHLINMSLTRSERVKLQWRVVLRLALIGGTALFMRYFFAEANTTQPVSSHFTEWAGATPEAGACATTEWLRASHKTDKLCTYRGKLHLAWSVPMSDPSYLTPSAFIHSFTMFAPFFFVIEGKGGIWIQGAFLFLTGPFMAGYLTPNLQEQASIWCFFSIAQISFMLFFIREQLVTLWSKDKAGASLLSSKSSKSTKKVE